ncbi:DUF2855 family protein [Phenylobacterium sp.]|uniref:DUF2855 family protein n=1 Tax=Phenylobacterium sp. TaxID=1871053 RepID=UPI00286D30F7|nr:DUF2855 family protein [Phenylobacterium sp.]
MLAWDLLVDRADLRRAEIVATDPAPGLADGEALLAVESFALTANNITYGAAGDQIGYWKFFPAPQGKGRIPVWGFARVVSSRAADAPVGLRLFGYWPMSSHTVARLQARGAGYVETSTHRAALPPTYNAYQAAQPDSFDDWRSLLRPLLMTGFLLDDQLAETPLAALVLSSASSKTAMGLAWLARRRGVKVIGLTSPAHADLLRRLDLYDEVVAYDALATLATDGPAAYVDFAGRSAVTQAAHAGLGASLTISLGVGITHWDAMGGAPPTTGPAPVFFFAPDRIRQRIKDWGPADLEARFDTALRAFVAASPWLHLRVHQGPEALLALYGQVVSGQVSPDDGHIVRPA